MINLERQPGLLIAPYTRQFRFLHRSFQEHLAACELVPMARAIAAVLAMIFLRRWFNW